MSGSDPLEERSLHQIHELQLSLNARGKNYGGCLDSGIYIYIYMYIFIMTRI